MTCVDICYIHSRLITCLTQQTTFVPSHTHTNYYLHNSQWGMCQIIFFLLPMAPSSRRMALNCFIVQIHACLVVMIFISCLLSHRGLRSIQKNKQSKYISFLTITWASVMCLCLACLRNFGIPCSADFRKTLCGVVLWTVVPPIDFNSHGDQRYIRFWTSLLAPMLRLSVAIGHRSLQVALGLCNSRISRAST